MVYTEKRKINRKTYYYRVISIRKADKISKKRVYLGHDLLPSELSKKESKADELLVPKHIIKSTSEIKKIKPKIVKVLHRYNIKKAGIFGSYARGEQTRNSDIDILIKPTKGMGFKFFGLQLELEKNLQRKVDLVSYNGLSQHLKKYILAEEIRIL